MKFFVKHGCKPPSRVVPADVVTKPLNHYQVEDTPDTRKKFANNMLQRVRSWANNKEKPVVLPPLKTSLCKADMEKLQAIIDAAALPAIQEKVEAEAETADATS